MGIVKEEQGRNMFEETPEEHPNFKATKTKNKTYMVMRA
jgi:hypothetical protein